MDDESIVKPGNGFILLDYDGVTNEGKPYVGSFARVHKRIGSTAIMVVGEDKIVWPISALKKSP